ncbi:MAG: FISUMP domain-containing protein [Chitinophagales bacterium]|nr:FISUMP domain-containing protein [Chitinophagales bacterium]
MRCLYLLLIVLLVASCRKDEGNTSDGDVATLVATLETADSLFLSYMRNGTALQQSLQRTADWAAAQPEVENAETYDSIFVVITMKSGLQTSIAYYETDADGKSIFRGGGRGSLAPLIATGGDCSNRMENKKVLLYMPEFSNFYKQAQLDTLLSRFQGNEQQFDVTVLKDAQCTPQLIETFGNYGLVILDTHGKPDGFLSGIKLDFTGARTENEVKQKLDQALGNGGYDKVKNGFLELGFAHGPFDLTQAGAFNSVVWVHGSYVKSLPPMPGTIIFGNMCYSGWTYAENIRFGRHLPPAIGEAFTSRQLVSYYGYAYDDGTSRKVKNTFAIIMEDSLVKALVRDQDSTGVAHLSNNMDEVIEPGNSTRPLYFKQYLNVNWCFGCGAGNITDPRDGQTYRTTCIGDEIWMAENLRYNAPGSQCYGGDVANCDTYGRMYTWDQAMAGAASSNLVPSGVQGVCPTGWHIPSYAEWNQTIVTNQLYAADIRANSPLWINPTVPANDRTGFSALPGGGFDTFNGYEMIGTLAAWWTTDQNIPGTGAPIVKVEAADSSVSATSRDKTDAYYIRCVKNK